MSEKIDRSYCVKAARFPLKVPIEHELDAPTPDELGGIASICIPGPGFFGRRDPACIKNDNQIYEVCFFKLNFTFDKVVF
jgi:hypothetical protein